jgi:glycosyltransferase involved in cell wall biosynthesis
MFARVPSEETRHGLQVEHPRYPVFPRVGMSAAPLALCAAVLPFLRRQIRDGHDFDLIDAHYFYPDGVAAFLLGRVLDRPVSVTARGSDLNIIAQHGVPRRWIRWAAQNADGLVAVSGGLKRRLVELGVGADRVRVLRNGVDLALFRPHDREAARAALGFTRPTLLAVGNLVALKRHRLMVDALTYLPEVELVIAGEGPERAGIEKLARERRVADRVRLLGRMPQDRLPEIYSAADLLLLVSTHEGWPNVLLESMACGTPVAVSPIDGIADIVGASEAGRILADDTPSGLASAIRELLAAPPSRATTRRYAEQFDWQSTTEGQMALFHEILERRSKARPAPAHAD